MSLRLRSLGCALLMLAANSVAFAQALVAGPGQVVKFVAPDPAGSSDMLAWVTGQLIDGLRAPLSELFALSGCKEGRALAAASEKRNAVLPKVPSVKARGFRQFVVNRGEGVLACQGPPADLINRRHASVRKALNTTDATHLQRRLKSENPTQGIDCQTNGGHGGLRPLLPRIQLNFDLGVMT